MNECKGPQGSRCNNSKLTESNIPTVRRLLAEGWLQKDVAKVFNVSGQTICYIAQGKTWTHVQ